MLTLGTARLHPQCSTSPARVLSLRKGRSLAVRQCPALAHKSFGRLLSPWPVTPRRHLRRLQVSVRQAISLHRYRQLQSSEVIRLIR